VKVLGAGRKSNKFNLASEPGTTRSRRQPADLMRVLRVVLYYIGGHGSSRQLPTTLFMHWRAISAQRSIICSHSLARRARNIFRVTMQKVLPALLPLSVSGGFQRKPIFCVCARSTIIKTHILLCGARA